MAFGIDDALMMVGGQLVSGLMGSESSKDAASIQANATDNATGEQRRQFDLSRSDLAPYRNAGNFAISKLRDLFGYGPGPATQTHDSVGKDQFDESAYLAANPDVAADPVWSARAYDHYNLYGRNEGRAGFVKGADTGPGALSRRMTIDDLLKDVVYNQSGIAKAAGTVDPNALTKKFSLEDFYNDPVVKLGMDFGLAEGRKGIDRGAGAAGLRNSGATLKALTKFGTDYAGGMADASRTRFEDDKSKLRDLLAYGDVMRAGAEDRFTGNQDRTYNQLAGAAGTGQTAASTGASLGTQMSGNIANLISAGGNAQAASKLAGNQSMSNAFSTIGNWWNQQNTLDKLTGRGASAVWKPAAGSYTGMAVPMGGGYLNTSGWE